MHLHGATSEHAGHSHSHAHPHGTATVLRLSLAVTLVYVIVLVLAGVRAHSLALLSEAGHNLSDVLALVLSLAAVYIQNRPPSTTKTYGY
ncbi:MAG TPA: cation transporter, partial [Terriglobales bacterium]|nr:cation transporter [Terriglobales bacterium]